MSQQVWFQCDPDTAVSATVRSYLRNLLAGHDDCGDAQLVASELADNAHAHGVPPIQVRLTRDDVRHSLLIEVDDHGHDALVLRPPSGDGEGGYGLPLIDKLATTWGTRQSDDHKTVWAELPISP